MPSPARSIEHEESSSASDPGAIGARERMRWFGTLWVMAMVFHHTDSHPFGAVEVLIFATPLLIFPTSSLAMLLFVGLIAANAAVGLPGIANHMMLALLVGIGLWITAGWTWVAGRRASPGQGPRTSFGARWFETAWTPIGLTLIVVYAFTVFHKLNTAFFDPVHSCAAYLINEGLDLNGLPTADLPSAVVLASAVGTVIVETSILVCLAVPRLRRWGVLIGVGFHSLLAWSSFYDFSTAVFAIYLLLVPAGPFASVRERHPHLRMWALLAFLGHTLVAISAALVGSAQSTFGFTWHTVLVVTWCAALLPFMVALLRALFSGSEPAPRWNWRPVALLIVPGLAFLNGATPYLGLKTVANYSMFSNIHTENGHSNHLIPGISRLQVFHFQDDPVAVHLLQGPDSDIPTPKWMQEEPPQVVPLTELRRLVWLWKERDLHGVRIEYVRDGEPHLSADAITDPVLAAPMPWWQRKLMSFRALTSAEGPDICRW